MARVLTTQLGKDELKNILAPCRVELHIKNGIVGPHPLEVVVFVLEFRKRIGEIPISQPIRRVYIQPTPFKPQFSNLLLGVSVLVLFINVDVVIFLTVISGWNP